MKATIATNTPQTMSGGEPLEGTQSNAHFEPALIKKKELAKRLSVSTRTIDDWVAKRIIPYIQMSPRFYLYDFDAVLAAIKKNYQVDARAH